MKKQHLLFGILLLGINSCSNGSDNSVKLKFENVTDTPKKSNVDEVNLLKETCDNYNKKIVLDAIYSIEGNTVETFVPDQKKISIVKLNSAVEKNSDTLDYYIIKYSEYLTRASKDIQNQKIKKISKWCSYNFLFYSLDNIDSGTPFFMQQIIYEMPETNHLFKNYINTDIGQDWDSLDMNQSILLEFDFLKYLTEIPEKDQLKLISAYIKKMSDSK